MTYTSPRWLAQPRREQHSRGEGCNIGFLNHTNSLGSWISFVYHAPGSRGIQYDPLLGPPGAPYHHPSLITRVHFELHPARRPKTDKEPGSSAMWRPWRPKLRVEILSPSAGRRRYRGGERPGQEGNPLAKNPWERMIWGSIAYIEEVLPRSLSFMTKAEESRVVRSPASLESTSLSHSNGIQANTTASHQ